MLVTPDDCTAGSTSTLGPLEGRDRRPVNSCGAEKWKRPHKLLESLLSRHFRPQQSKQTVGIFMTLTSPVERVLHVRSLSLTLVSRVMLSSPSKDRSAALLL